MARDYPSALKILERIRSVFPYIKNIEYVRAHCFLKLGKHAEAALAASAELKSYPESQNSLDILEECGHQE